MCLSIASLPPSRLLSPPLDLSPSLTLLSSSFNSPFSSLPPTLIMCLSITSLPPSRLLSPPPELSPSLTSLSSSFNSPFSSLPPHLSCVPPSPLYLPPFSSLPHTYHVSLHLLSTSFTSPLSPT
uniref:Uncharacterized protein n=1 Tax=Knipowitschia caucasica TaxID=637954 RepID=A0AAV2L8U3_KNICA